MYKVIGQILNGSSTVSLVPLCAAAAAHPHARWSGGRRRGALPPSHQTTLSPAHAGR